MQRWMLYAGLALIGLALLAGGGLYAYREYLHGKPDKIWVPLAMRADFPVEDQEKLAAQIDEKLRNTEILRKIVIDADLQSAFKQPDQDAAVKDLNKRLFIEVGTAASPMGSVPSINIGVKGIWGEHDALNKAAEQTIKEVWLMIGIDPTTGKPLPKSGVVPAGDF
ncbi:MAG: hypothetical protein H7Y36_06295 [Armatimonadetes bacterium]|nr:hypothetical protein [Akkermansiaceae bacterium]